MGLKKSNILIAYVFVLLPACNIGQEDTTIENVKTDSVAETKVDVEVKKIYLEFIPSGWVFEREILHDIDSDGTQDAMLITIEDPSIKENDRRTAGNRILTVLMGGENGGLKRTSVATDLLLCETCGGMLAGFGDAEAYIGYKEDNKLHINWLQGSRISLEMTLIFDYDSNAKSLVLISDEVDRKDRNAGTNTIVHRDFAVGTKTVDSKSEQMEKKLILIDSVRFLDYADNDD